MITTTKCVRINASILFCFLCLNTSMSLAISSTATTQSASLTLVNGDFESPQIPSGRWDKTSSEIPGWESNTAIEFYKSGVYNTPSVDGSQFIDLASPDADMHSIKQTIASTPGQELKITFSSQMGVIHVKAGGEYLGAFGASNYEWKQQTTYYTPTSNSTEIEFYAYNADAWGNETGNFLDAISVTPSDAVSPQITSITRLNPIIAATDADSVTFRVTFTENVNNVDLSDFTINASNNVTAEPSSTTQVNQQVSDITLSQVRGNGELYITVGDENDIIDNAGNPAIDAIAILERYEIYNDETPPTLVSIRRHQPVDEFTNADSVLLDVQFSEPVTNVDLSDFELHTQGTLTANLTSISKEADDRYYINVTNIEGDGELGVDIQINSDITDFAGNLISITHK